MELINAILEKAGKKTALTSSIRFKIDEENQKNTTGNTMPGRLALQSFLRKAVNKKCEYAIIEATSQGFGQYRHKFIDWDAAIFLNLHPEHIESHGSFEKYRNAKLSFFEYVATHRRKLFFINEADENARYFAEASGSGEVVFFSREKFIENELNKGSESIGDWLSSDFNLENAAAATAFAKSQGISWSVIKQALAFFKGVPGRMETIQPEPFRVVVDYAHTPDSLEQIYKSLAATPRDSGKKLICVLGAAGGGRDKWKRPVMGKVASRYCKLIFLTDEDPYDENPTAILDEIASGILPGPKVFKVLDRKEAIRQALDSAKPGDTAILTGKGSETSIHIAHGKTISWNEAEVVRDILRK